MIELQSDELIFAFPELLEPLRERTRDWVDEHLECATIDEKDMLPSSREEIHRVFAGCLPRVRAAISFQRTLRLPENNQDYPLPLGLGRFSIYSVDDFSAVPEAWQERGGVMLPMHSTEALWLNFYADYPMALRVATGGSCAVSGADWSPFLQSSPQNYVVLGCQPWLDGVHAGPKIVRQFVARPLDQGVLAPHALSGEERWGGLQFQAFPLRADEFWRQSLKATLSHRWDELMTPIRQRLMASPPHVGDPPDWTFTAGGRIRLKIIPDPYDLSAWDTTRFGRCFAHLCLADDWQRLTGIRPPQKPPTAEDYADAGVPCVNPEAEKTHDELDSALFRATSAQVATYDSNRSDKSSPPPTAPRSIVRLNPDLRQTVREF